MALSYNGFAASPDPGSIDIRSYTLPGTSVTFPGGIVSWAAPLLLWAAGEWHARIEPVKPGWCWGWNYRQTTGGGSLSNHASGTAIDVNAPLHPYGRRGTFTSRQRDALTGILADANRGAKVLTSGEFYRSDVDGMHLEIADGATKAQVIAAGERLNAPKEWDVMATRAEIREVVDNALAAFATSDALKNAVRQSIEAERPEDARAVLDTLGDDLAADTEVRKLFRSNVRFPVDAELTQRKLGT